MKYYLKGQNLLNNGEIPLEIRYKTVGLLSIAYTQTIERLYANDWTAIGKQSCAYTRIETYLKNQIVYVFRFYLFYLLDSAMIQGCSILRCINHMLLIGAGEVVGAAEILLGTHI